MDFIRQGQISKPFGVRVGSNLIFEAVHVTQDPDIHYSTAISTESEESGTVPGYFVATSRDAEKAAFVHAVVQQSQSHGAFAGILDDLKNFYAVASDGLLSCIHVLEKALHTSNGLSTEGSTETHIWIQNVRQDLVVALVPPLVVEALNDCFWLAVYVVLHVFPSTLFDAQRVFACCCGC